MLAHHDSVTNVCYQASTANLLSVSHDGSLKVWDLRKYGLVQEISVILLTKIFFLFFTIGYSLKEI